MPIPGKSLVVLVRSDLAIDIDGNVDYEIVHHMLDSGLDAVSAGNDDYLRSLFGVSGSVGMKVNTIGGPKMSTQVELVDAFSNLLADSGIGKNRQIIWDRSDYELKAAGFTIATRGNGPFCYGTDHSGAGYNPDLVSHGKIGGLLSSILTNHCGAVVNIPVLKDHGVAGMTGALKNHYGSIHNPNKYHGEGCNPYISDLNNLEQIKSKQRLIIMDALKVQFQGGPSYLRRWVEHFGAILFSTDPVAIDTAGYGIIERLRAKSGLESLEDSRRKPIYLKTAADSGLGNSDLARIQIKEINI